MIAYINFVSILVHVFMIELDTCIYFQIIGCQPAASCVMYESVKAGKILDIPSDDTLSDGTAGGIEPGAVSI